MNEHYSEEAIRLAKAPYISIVFLDKTTDGAYGYVAKNPELAGCMSQGDSPEEAIANLLDARMLYIDSLLEDGLPVPEPKLNSTSYLLVNMGDLLGINFGKKQAKKQDDVSTNLSLAYEVKS